MDPFKLLTQGARFNKNNPAHKAALFSQKQQKQQLKRLNATGSSDEDSDADDDDAEDAAGPAVLPAELDFFKVGAAATGAEGGKGKRKRDQVGPGEWGGLIRQELLSDWQFVPTRPTTALGAVDHSHSHQQPGRPRESSTTASLADTLRFLCLSLLNRLLNLTLLCFGRSSSPNTSYADKSAQPDGTCPTPRFD